MSAYGAARAGAITLFWVRNHRCCAATARGADPVGLRCATATPGSAVLESVGREMAAELATVEPSEQRAALLQRNRPLLGRTVATLLINAVGNALPTADTDRIRIGAIDDRHALRPTKRS